MFDPKIGSFLLGLASSAVGWAVWWINSINERQQRAVDAGKKEFAAERDFNHLKNDYKQLSQNVEFLAKEQDARFDRVDLSLTEIKALLIANKNRTDE